MVTAATIYMALLGPAGLADVARASHANAVALRKLLTSLPRVESVFSAPAFHEFVVRLPSSVAAVLQQLRAHGILGGLDLAQHYPELGHALLVCATETKTPDDLQRYASQMTRVLSTPGD
jgi:glycine dehydrogenase subunit 1